MAFASSFKALRKLVISSVYCASLLSVFICNLCSLYTAQIDKKLQCIDYFY